MRRLVTIVILATTLSFPFLAAYADVTENKTGISAANFDRMKTNVNKAGFNFTQTSGALDIVVDEATLLNAIPELSKQDFIVKVDPKDIEKAPMTVSVYAAAIPFSVTILSGVYAKDHKVDKMHVSVYMMPPASTEKQLCFSFDYTRDLYDKLDMNTTSSNDFIAKTPAFAFTEWCKSQIDKEEHAT